MRNVHSTLKLAQCPALTSPVICYNILWYSSCVFSGGRLLQVEFGREFIVAFPIALGSMQHGATVLPSACWTGWRPLGLSAAALQVQESGYLAHRDKGSTFISFDTKIRHFVHSLNTYLLNMVPPSTGDLVMSQTRPGPVLQWGGDCWSERCWISALSQDATTRKWEPGILMVSPWP